MSRLLITLRRQDTGQSVFIPVDAEDPARALVPHERGEVRFHPSEPYNEGLPVGNVELSGPGSLLALAARHCARGAGEGWDVFIS
ncbi:MAG: hypothetical protein ACKVS8_03560 [Phycisphaerales bacterium]